MMNDDTPATPAPITPMPASIVKAISAIKATVEAVKKSQKNQHGGYMFASTDDIYAAVARKMGEVGYHVHAFEEQCEIVRVEKEGKTVQWLHAVYSFIHATETDTWSHPKDRRTLYIQVTGPQTFQAAQSYLEKGYLRSLFKLPTGDMDLDTMPQAETEEAQEALAGNGKKRKSSSAAKKDGTTEQFNALVASIRGCSSKEEIRDLVNLQAELLSTLPERWSEIANAEIEDKLSAFAE